MKLEKANAFILVTIVTEKGISVTLPCHKYNFNKKGNEVELSLDSNIDGVPCEGVKEYYRKNPTAPIGTEVLLKMLILQGIALIYNTATLMYDEQGELFIPEGE